MRELGIVGKLVPQPIEFQNRLDTLSERLPREKGGDRSGERGGERKKFIKPLDLSPTAKDFDHSS